MSDKPRYTVLRKLLLFVLPFVVSAIIATAAVLSWTNYNYFRKTIRQDYANIIKSSAGEIRVFMGSALNALNSLAGILAATKPDLWQKQMALTAFNHHEKKFISVSLFSEDCRVVASTAWTPQKLNEDDMVLFEKARKGVSAVSKVHLMEKDRLPFVKLAVPVKHMGRVDEVLWGELNLKSVWDLLTGIRIGRSGQVFLMDFSGRYIAHREIERVMLPAPPNAPAILERIRSNRTPVSWNDVENGKRYYFLGATIPDLGWIIILRQPLPEIYVHFYRNIVWVAIITLAGCLLAIWLGISRVKRFVAPIQRLHRQVLRMGKGKLDQKVAVSSRDEIGDLSRAFNQMIDTLKAHINSEINIAKKLSQAQNLALIGTASSKLNHEVGNLINNVTLAIRTLSVENLSSAGRATLDILKKEAQRVDAFIHNLLQFAKAPELNLSPTNLRPLIEEVLNAQKPAADAKNITFKRDWPPSLPEIPLDPQLIYQVFGNIIKNSLEAMTRGGLIRISGRLDDRYLHVRIADNGPGIAPELLDQIFEPFFTTKGRQGTGLGMAIVKSNVTAHRGDIQCESKLGEGTVFRINLPLQ